MVFELTQVGGRGFLCSRPVEPGRIFIMTINTLSIVPFSGFFFLLHTMWSHFFLAELIFNINISTY